MIINGIDNLDILQTFGFHSIKENQLLYNHIISERVKCEVLFNDYRKDNYNRNIIMNN